MEKGKWTVAIKINLRGGGSDQGGDEFDDESSAREYFAGRKEEYRKQGSRIVYAQLITPDGTYFNLL